MTAGAGVVPPEMPSRACSVKVVECTAFQIWVNLPARDKLMAPRYQEIKAAAILKRRAVTGR